MWCDCRVYFGDEQMETPLSTFPTLRETLTQEYALLRPVLELVRLLRGFFTHSP
jgi:hypothetical protein